MSDYEDLKDKAEELGKIDDINSVLTWDQEVMMPEKGGKARSKQKSLVSRLRHRILTSEELSTIIEDLKDKDLEEKQSSVLREISREHEKARKVDSELMEKISEKESETVEKWKKAREESDFSIVKEDLEELVELKREYAGQIDPDKEPYKVLFDDFEPYIEFSTMERIMEKLESELSDLVEKIRGSGAEPDSDALKGEFSEEKQEELNREIAEQLGFDFERGRLDTSDHPFTLGNPFDTRITTRFDEENLWKALGPTIHETGHGLYQQGLDKEEYGNPLGQSRDLSIHESQSRLWENHVGKSREFWNFYTPKLKQKFPEKLENVSAEECYEFVNRVKEDNMIRVEADEISYHLHIALRFELERKLVNGEIEVEELPELWNQKMKDLLGLEPENDAEGVLQDIHWYWGSLGYFTTYSLGSVLAAQIFSSANEEIEDLEGKIENGEFEPLLQWLRENIHRHGQSFETEELVKKATGEPPTADYFLDYIKSKYGDLYNIDTA